MNVVDLNYVLGLNLLDIEEIEGMNFLLHIVREYFKQPHETLLDALHRLQSLPWHHTKNSNQYLYGPVGDSGSVYVTDSCHKILQNTKFI